MAGMSGRWGVAVLVCAACGDEGPLPVVREGSACPAEVMRFVNDHWIATHPAASLDATWEDATYMIGNLAAADALDDQDYVDYAVAWALDEHFELNGDIDTRNADNHAAGQAYLALYERFGDPVYLGEISVSLDNIVRSGERDDWSWIDAQFMAAPTFTWLGERFGQQRYVDTMFELYTDARQRRNLYDETEGLWYRDENYLFPEHQTDGGKKIFWSRGNGWVIAAHARVLQHLPDDSAYRPAFEDALTAMAAALAEVQRPDGLWNVSLADADDHPGPESSGTSFFTYGIAYGINEGLLDRATYLPVVEAGWRGLVATAVRADGELGYVQGVGEKPGSSQPVTLRSTHDYGVGAFLLAGTEMMRLGVDLDCP